MGYYESLFILHPDMSSQEVDELIERMEEVVTSGGGQVAQTERWGKRKLAYKVRKQRTGYYVLMQISIEPVGLKELERNFRMSERVLKYQNVRIRKEAVGRTTLDREVMEEAIAETPRQAAKETVAEAAPAAPSQPEPVAGAAAEPVPEAVALEGDADAASPEEDRPSTPAASETDERERVSPPEEET